MKNVAREILSDEAGGKMSLNRVVSLGTAAILSYGFLRHSLSHPLSWDMMTGYALAMGLATSPTLLARFLGLRYGQKP